MNKEELLEKNIEEFISYNKKHWGDFHGKVENGHTLIALKSSATHYTMCSRVAKSIEEAAGCLPLAIINSFGFLEGPWKKIYGSYDISNFIYYRRYSWNVFYMIKAAYLSIKFFFKQKNIDDFLQLKTNGIYIGDLIYDTILRNNLGLYTLRQFRAKYLKYVFTAYHMAIIYDKIFSDYDIKYVHLGLVIYIKHGVVARIAHKHGASVLLARRNLMKDYKGLDISEGQFRPRLEEVEELKKCSRVYSDVDQYLANRFSGEINEMDAIRTFKDKKYYNHEELCQALGLDKNKPIVFIMAHAFSDGPHHSPTDRLIFRDYFIWLIETVKYASKIKNINWIVKSHPMSFKYKEEGVVEKLVKKYGGDSVHLVPDDFNAKSIKNIAHAIVTVQGKAALEFGYFGIPTVVASWAPYSGFGVVWEPKSKEEYFSLLEKIDSLPRLSEEQIKTIKVLIAIILIYSRTNDPMLPFERNLLYKRMTEEEKWELFCDLIKNYDRSKDEFYQRIKDLINLNLYGKYLE